jgi:hypothetical protein
MWGPQRLLPTPLRWYRLPGLGRKSRSSGVRRLELGGLCVNSTPATGTPSAPGSVEHILAKLGLGSRTQVATWVMEQGAASSGTR